MNAIPIPRITHKPNGFPQAVPCWEILLDKAYLWCPHGHVSSLEDHTISADGSVSPSVVCPRRDCGWHETVKLLDWSPAMSPITPIASHA